MLLPENIYTNTHTHTEAVTERGEQCACQLQPCCRAYLPAEGCAEPRPAAVVLAPRSDKAPRPQILDHPSLSPCSLLCIRAAERNLTLDLWLRGSAVHSAKSAHSGETRSSFWHHLQAIALRLGYCKPPPLLSSPLSWLSDGSNSSSLGELASRTFTITWHVIYGSVRFNLSYIINTKHLKFTKLSAPLFDTAVVLPLIIICNSYIRAISWKHNSEIVIL